jgi:SWI/SNF-related matrix-associated actin-dependent regulator of chromatin subfamily A-like protein 1
MTFEEDRIRASFAVDSEMSPLVPDGQKLLPFQRAGVEYCAGLKDAIIADEMGLGKTIQALALANELGPDELLVVCPAGLRINWSRESARWLCFSKARIISYNELADNFDEYAAKVWPLVVFDESQYLKNPTSKRSRASLALRAESRLFLSGTPIVNRPRELWPILQSIDPAAWGSLHEYGKAYCQARRQYFNGRSIWNYDGACNLVDLQRRLRSTVMVRRLKKDVLKDLPAKRRQIIELPYPHCPGAKLVALLGAVWSLKEKRDSEFTPDNVQRLRDRSSALFEELAAMRHIEAVSKIPSVLSHVADLLDNTGKVVVFAHHRDVIDGLHEGFARMGIRSTWLYGGMLDVMKARHVDDFQKSPDCRVFIGQLDAAGVGISLTAASTVVFAEMSWVPGTMAQCEDRLHRIGQRDSVLVQYLVLDGSLDARISKTLLRKAAVIDQALDSPPEQPLDWVSALSE